jgi:hypothetical protein
VEQTRPQGYDIIILLSFIKQAELLRSKRLPIPENLQKYPINASTEDKFPVKSDSQKVKQSHLYAMEALGCRGGIYPTHS